MRTCSVAGENVGQFTAEKNDFLRFQGTVARFCRWGGQKSKIAYFSFSGFFVLKIIHISLLLTELLTKSWVAFFETQCTCCVATHFRQGSRFTFSFFTCFFLNATVDCYQFFSHELWLPTIYLLTSFVTTAYLLCHVTYVCFGGTDFPFIFEIIDPQFICLLGSSSAFTNKRTWVLHKNSI